MYASDDVIGFPRETSIDGLLVRLKPDSIMECGFTLLELLIVLLIIAFVSAIALRPEWRHSDAAELKSAALTLASDLRRTRSWAITHNEVAVVRLDLDHPGYRRPGANAARTLPRDVAVSASLQDETAPRTSGQIDLRFWPDGTAVGADLLLTLHGHRRHVTLDWLTGHAATSP